MLASHGGEPAVLNLNIPDRPLAEIDEWAWTTIAEEPPQESSRARLEVIAGHTNSYRVEIDWGSKWFGENGSDVHAIAEGKVSATWVGRLRAETDGGTGIGEALDRLLG